MFNQNIEHAVKANHNFRQVIFTTPLSQIVLMSLQPDEDIGMETHDGHDQIFIFTEGQGQAIIAGETQAVEEDSLVVVPAGTLHNIQNTGSKALQFWTIYTPPTHKDGTLHATKAEAQADESDHPD